jgi:tetratricopeptide (TPR) repeat protein
MNVSAKIIGKKMLASMLLFFIASLFFTSHAGSSRIETLKKSHLPAQTVARKALEDSLYYRFDPWFELFENRIQSLRKAPETVDNLLELMTFYFAYAGMLGEVSHTLAFTSHYKLDSVAKPFSYYSQKAKETANILLDKNELTDSQRAKAYLYLGGAEGYISIFDYGQGDLLSAVVNGFQADGHLEQTLQLNPDEIEAHFGLGMYRYGNSRMGGVSNFLMQGGRDLRLNGLNHIEEAIRLNSSSSPLAYKTLIWFNIAEQINPDNVDLEPGDPLSPVKRRERAIELIAQFKARYFSDNSPENFIGNKEFYMMSALQATLDGRYEEGKKGFEKVLEICEFLKNEKKMAINPQLITSVLAGIKFCDLMLLDPSLKDEIGIRSACLKIDEQLDFLEGGGAMLEYDASKIRQELQNIFFKALKQTSKKLHC